MSSINLQGIGMTSQRTRDRLIERLRAQGISNQKVLDTIRATPRHIFLDEALAHRAYETGFAADRLSANPVSALYCRPYDRAVIGQWPA